MRCKKGYEERKDRSDDLSINHGTRSTYLYYRCSCDACRRSNREHQETLKDREPPVHGESGYGNYGCRCAVCKRAWRNMQWRLYPERIQTYYSKSWREANGFPPAKWAWAP